VPLIRRHPFLLLGLVTLAWFFGVEALNRAGLAQAVAAAAPPLRVLIIPMYVVWLPVYHAQRGARWAGRRP